MKYRLVIFDMDGTILNTLDDLAESINYALEKAGFAKRTLDEVRRFVGNGIGKLVERAVPEGTTQEKTEEVLTYFNGHYAKHCADHTKPYEGIPELLKTLKESGCLTAVVSNKADFAVQELCREYFPGMFDVSVGEKNGVRKKPAPDTVNSVLERLGAECAEAVYIGDSEVDIQTADNAGMDCIAVDWGFRSREELVKAQAVKIVSQPAEILTLLN